MLLKTVAEAANVSVATVSMALAGHSNIGADTKRRIAQISAELGYQPRRRLSARAGSANKVAGQGQAHRTLGRVGFMLLGASLNDPSNSSILQSLVTHCTQTGVGLQMAAVDSVAELAMAPERALALARDVDGLILMGYVDVTLLQALRGAGVAFVVLGYTRTTQREALAANIHVVGNDDVAMGQLATASLLGAGHRRVAFVCDVVPRGLSHWRWRNGYAIAHQEAGVPLDPSLIQISGVEHSSGDAAAEAMLRLDPPPTGFVVPDPQIASRFLAAMLRRGTEIPRSSVVIGCDPALVDRYGVGDCPRVQYDHEALVAMGLRQLRLLFEDVDAGPATIQMAFAYHNLPEEKTSER